MAKFSPNGGAGLGAFLGGLAGYYLSRGAGRATRAAIGAGLGGLAGWYGAKRWAEIEEESILAALVRDGKVIAFPRAAPAAPARVEATEQKVEARVEGGEKIEGAGAETGEQKTEEGGK